MFEIVRWTTLHPALTHLPLGILPLAALSYLMAAWRRSERWTFVGDVSSFVASGAIVLVVIFGVVAYLLVPQPPDLGRWPLVHAATGFATAALVIMFAVARALTPEPRPPTGWATVVLISIVTLSATFTGWVGGEILVFHGGMAVNAVRPAPPSEALTPSATNPGNSTPR